MLVYGNDLLKLDNHDIVFDTEDQVREFITALVQDRTRSSTKIEIQKWYLRKNKLVF